MYNLTFLYEENGFTVSYYIVLNKATGRRYIRRSLAVVDQIVREKVV